jgi:hypothetical protein
MRRSALLWGIVAVAVAAGCSKHGSNGSGSGSAGSAGASPSDCATVIGAVFDRVLREGMNDGATEDGTAMTPGLRNELDKIAPDLAASVAPTRDAMIRACTEDHWSADTLECVRTAKTAEAFGACQAKLTPAQNRHAEQLVEEAEAKTTAASPECQRYAKLEIQCGKAKESDRRTILQFCEKAKVEKTDTTYRQIALESGCAQTAADCDAYHACIDAK